MTTMQRQHSAKPPTFPVVTANAGKFLQRKCACGGSAGLSGECEGCSKQNLAIQRSTRNSELSTRNSELGTRNSKASRQSSMSLAFAGSTLDQHRAFMEPRFGHDFSRVRVHSDAHAAESARAIGALA